MTKDIVLAHYIGCSPNSASYSHLLWRIMNAVQDALGFADAIPPAEDHEQVARYFLKVIPHSLIPY
jgi:hypothetical protein